MENVSGSGLAAGLRPPARTTYTVLLLCFLTIVSEGYDVGVMGVIVPALLHDAQWHLTPMQIGEMGSAALIGTLFGSYLLSVVSDMMGRKPLIIGCVTLFSISMLAAATLQTPTGFWIARFIGGIGLGGVISTACALTVEYSPPEQRNRNFAIMYAGYSIGALVSALVGMGFLASHGWRFVVAAGAIPLLLVPFLIRLLPESLELLIARGRHDKAIALARRLSVPIVDLAHLQKAPAEQRSLRSVFAEVFSRQNAMGTICMWVAQVAAVTVIYGLGTWLPQTMRKLGYDLGSSLSFLAVFMLSSAIGGILIGRISDRLGTRKTIAGGYVIGAIAIACLAIRGGGLLQNYFLVALAGCGSIGVAMVQLGFIANYYAAGARASATGWAVGIGRVGAMGGPLIGGYLAAQNIDVAWNFYTFSASALIAGLAIALTPRPQAGTAAATGDTPPVHAGTH